MKRALVLASMVVLGLGCGGGSGKGATEPKEPNEPAAARPPSLLPVPEELKADVEQSERIGLMLFQIDRATARASDAVLAHAGSKPDARVQGWIAIPIGPIDAPKFRVFFLGEDGGEVRAYYAAEVAGPDAAPQVRTIAGEVADPEVARMFRARQVAASSGGQLLVDAEVELCERYNTVVMPAMVRGDREGYLVYLLAATTDAKVNILAGHHRIHVGVDGKATAEPMSRSCVVSSPQPPKAGFQALGPYVTHHLTPFPLESHVFASLNHGIDLIVGTSQETAWMVRKGEVHRFGLTP